MSENCSEFKFTIDKDREIGITILSFLLSKKFSEANFYGNFSGVGLIFLNSYFLLTEPGR